MDQGCNTHSKAIRESCVFNPDLWLHVPKHTLAALAGQTTLKLNSKRSSKKIQYSMWNLKHKQLPTYPWSHREQSSLIILPCPTPPPIPQFQDIHQTKHILHIPRTAGIEKYLTFQTSTKVVLISYMSDISLSTAENRKFNNQSD